MSVVAVLVLAGCAGTPVQTSAPTAAVTAAPTTAVTAEPTTVPTERPTVPPTPAPTIPPFVVLSDRDWAKVIKNPDAYNGSGFQLWACVTQFDAATGTGTFRADASNKKQADPSIDYAINGANSFFAGLVSDLSDIVAKDLVFIDALGSGSLSYDTQAGGNTTVPLFGVFKITREGSCG